MFSITGLLGCVIILGMYFAFMLEKIGRAIDGHRQATERAVQELSTIDARLTLLSQGLDKARRMPD